MQKYAVYWPEGGAASQPVLVYWPENVIDWLGKWRPTCVIRHARGQKFQSFRRKWPFYMDLYSMSRTLLCEHSPSSYSKTALTFKGNSDQIEPPLFECE
jgi:hypothetical protein